MKDHSKVIRGEGFRWGGVPLREYKNEGTHFKSITRQNLLGEGNDEQALGIILRYFEIQPGGYSSLERHQHPHSVMVIRGRGRVLLDDEVHSVGPLDCVYVSPHTVHQFQAAGHEPFGFLCIVARERDRPVLVGADEARNDAARC
jgi:quercetin dioxygenase-like cupin family protein